MTITWINCAERMPPDRHDRIFIARASLGGVFDADIYLVSGAVMSRYYDEFMLEHTSYMPYTEEAWSELNK